MTSLIFLSSAAWGRLGPYRLPCLRQCWKTTDQNSRAGKCNTKSFAYASVSRVELKLFTRASNFYHFTRGANARCRLEGAQHPRRIFTIGTERSPILHLYSALSGSYQIQKIIRMYDFPSEIWKKNVSVVILRSPDSLTLMKGGNPPHPIPARPEAMRLLSLLSRLTMQGQFYQNTMVNHVTFSEGQSSMLFLVPWILCFIVQCCSAWQPDSLFVLVVLSYRISLATIVLNEYYLIDWSWNAILTLSL